MRVGCFLDAMTGYNEGESERIKAIGEMIRTATWLLWNIQVAPEDKKDSPGDIWKFPWDETDEVNGEKVSEEEKKAGQEYQDRIIGKM